MANGPRSQRFVLSDGAVNPGEHFYAWDLHDAGGYQASLFATPRQRGRAVTHWHLCVYLRSGARVTQLTRTLDGAMSRTLYVAACEADDVALRSLLAAILGAGLRSDRAEVDAQLALVSDVLMPELRRDEEWSREQNEQAARDQRADWKREDY